MYGRDEGPSSYQQGGSVDSMAQPPTPTPTHVAHNRSNQRMIADTAKRDLPRAAHLL